VIKGGASLVKGGVKAAKASKEIAQGTKATKGVARAAKVEQVAQQAERVEYTTKVAKAEERVVQLEGGSGASEKVAEVVEKITEINLEDIKPTHHITKSEAQMKELFNDIRANGIKEPIKYAEHNGIKYIVDGQHRFFVARKLRIQNIPAKQVRLPHAGYKDIADLELEPGKHPGFWKYVK
jgi:Asp-tRNA(Asn)/Glu-tRNA(Gln) amidotransferase C subunit